MVRRWLILAPLALLAAFVIAVVTRDPLAGRPKPSPMVGQLMPGFDLPGLDAAHPGLASADLRQGTVTLVNLFASWCLPCVAEAPQLKALANRGVVVHAVAVRDRPAEVQAFLKARDDPFRRVGLDPKGDVPHALAADGLPETYVVDGNGVVRYRHVGEIRPEDVPVLLEQIARAK